MEYETEIDRLKDELAKSSKGFKKTANSDDECFFPKTPAKFTL